MVEKVQSRNPPALATNPGIPRTLDVALCAVLSSVVSDYKNRLPFPFTNGNGATKLLLSRKMLFYSSKGSIENPRILSDNQGK